MSGRENLLDIYKIHTKKRVYFILTSMALLSILIVISISVGSVRIGISEVIAALVGQGNDSASIIIWKIRIPRVLTAIIAGIGLAVSGAAMQTILRNPLGSPFTLGISHSAAFGAAFAIVVLGVGSIHSSSVDAVILNNPCTITICAFGFSLIATLIMILLAKYKGASPETMILTGVALGSLFTAATTAIEYFAEDVQLSSIIFWTFGDVGRTLWGDLWIIAAVVIPSVIYFFYNMWNYNVLDSGEETAKSLGVNVERVRIGGLLVASLVTALIVSFVGIIGFIGLVVPHIVRKIIGGDERYLIPSSCIVGAILLLVSDTVARTIISPIVLPVGILTSFLGAPLFIYLVIKGRRYW
jgi:iron complex transport system permease protein